MSTPRESEAAQVSTFRSCSNNQRAVAVVVVVAVVVAVVAVVAAVVAVAVAVVVAVVVVVVVVVATMTICCRKSGNLKQRCRSYKRL